MQHPEKKHLVQPVVLSGGAGTRLWPLSRAGFPKQFLCFASKESLFQQAVTRLATLECEDIALAPLAVVGSDEHRFLALEQLREVRMQAATLLLEPCGRNTAPALTLAALHARESGDPILIVTPADQVIVDQAAFAQAAQHAIREAADGHIVVLGIAPDMPSTGYGYIKTAGTAAGAQGAVPVERFVEKPDAQTARRYLQDGTYHWNAGIFVVRASVWMSALQRFRPDIAQACAAAWDTRRSDMGFIRPGDEEFAKIPSESIDYAVMERCPGSEFLMKMVPLKAGWNDLGVWDAVWDALPKDAAGNAQSGDVIAIDCSDTLVHATSRLVSVVGIHNLVVVETADAVMVADKSRSQDVRQIVEMLKRQGREELVQHRKVHRPWGWYDGIDQGSRFKVKRILVKPGASLSLQMHHHRAEHWVVVSGTAEITCGDKVLLLSENQSTYIPLGETHRLRNPGTIALEIIEVQSGSYLGEDDIVRLEDMYARHK